MPITLKKGFTLLEILLVIGIIAVLAGIVIMAINPSRQLAQVRNTQRRLNINEIDKALKQYYIDNHSYPTSSITTTLTEICNTGTATSTHTITCTGLADLSFLVPTYLTAIPTDPQATSTTGYLVMRDNNNKVALLSSLAELQTTIAVPQWTCGMPLIDNRDSQSYATVLIGSQCWMQENLNVGTMITSCTNGYLGVCTTGGDTVQNQGTSTTNIQKYCYNDSESNCTTYGGLYQWNQAMGGSVTPGAQGICPADWHVPTDNEFKTLEMYLGMTQAQVDATSWRGTTQGDQLKNTGLCGGRITCNTSGFKALLAGGRNADGSFSNLGSFTALWSSLESGASAWERYLYSGNATVNRLTYAKAIGFSVRCLKD